MPGVRIPAGPSDHACTFEPRGSMKPIQPSTAPPSRGRILHEPLFRRVLILSVAVHLALLTFGWLVQWRVAPGGALPAASLPAILHTTAAGEPDRGIAPSIRPQPGSPSPVRLTAPTRTGPRPSAVRPLTVPLPASHRQPLSESLARALHRPALSSAPPAPAAMASASARMSPTYQSRSNPQPTYPRVARRRGWQGTTVLAVQVSEKGEADQVTVEQSSGYRLLDRAAADTVRRWQFQPGRIGQTTVAMMVRVPVVFRLADG